MTSLDLTFTMDDDVVESLRALIVERDGGHIRVKRGPREVWLMGNKFTELRLLFLGTLRLTVSRVAFNKTRQGTMTAVLVILEQFCRDNGIERLLIQSVETPEMASFCVKNGFRPDPNASFSYDGCILGDYIKTEFPSPIPK